LYKGWYKDGTLHYEANLKDGEYNGLWKEWDEDGVLILSENYKNGKLMEEL